MFEKIQNCKIDQSPTMFLVFNGPNGSQQTAYKDCFSSLSDKPLRLNGADDVSLHCQKKADWKTKFQVKTFITQCTFRVQIFRVKMSREFLSDETLEKKVVRVIIFRDNIFKV